MTLNISPDSHPIVAILAIHLPKQANSQILFLKTLLRQTTFHHFSKEEMVSLYGLLSNGKSLSDLKNDFNFKSEVSLSSVESILSINQFPDQMSFDISAFFILRATITFLCQPSSSFQSSSYLKLLSLINYILKYEKLNSSYANSLKNAFVYLLSENVKNIQESFLEGYLKQISLFIQKAPDFPQKLVDAMVFTLKNLSTQIQAFSAIDLSFLNLSAKIINSFVGKRNFDNLKEPLLSSLSPFLKKFDPIAFKFLSQIITIFPFSDIRPIIEQIPNAIIDHIEKDKTYFPVSFKDIDSLPEPLVVEMTSNQRFPFQTMDTFKDGFAMKYPTLPLEKKKLTYFFPTEIFDLLRNLYVIAKSSDAQQFFSSNFIKIINENSESEKLFDIMIICLMICRDIQLSKVILQSKLFSPRITKFNYINNFYGNNYDASQTDAKATTENDKQAPEFESNFEVFFTARTIIFRLLTDISSIFEEIISPISKMPTILADFFHYFSLDVQSVMKLNSNNDSFIKSLCNLSSLYQTANIEMTEHLKEIEFARGQIIRFTLNLLSQKENVEYLSSTIIFNQMIFSYLYEAALRSTVLSTIVTASSKYAIDFSVCISDFFYNLFEIVKDKKFKQEVIQTINKIIILNNNYQKFFPNCIHPLIADLKELEKDEFSKEYLLDIIQFVSNASENTQTINSQIILDTIKRVEGDEPSDAIYKALLSLIAGETLTEVTPTFEIKHPNILTLFLMAFNKSTRYVSILKFLKDLVVNSRENAIACQNGNLDLLLLDIIQSCKCDTDNEIIAPAVGLFVHIASVSSSPETIRRFFKIFAPIAPNTVSPNQSFFFATLSDLVATEEFKPFYYFGLQQKSPVVKVNGITGRNLSTGFTVVLWLFSDPSPESSPRLFTISDDKQRGYEVYINSNTLKLKVNYGGGNATNDDIREKDLPISSISKGKWLNCSLSFLKTENGLSVIPCIDQTVSTPLELEWVELDRGQLKVIFGGVEENSQVHLDKAALGPFGIFSALKSSTIIDIARNNMRTRPDLGRCFIYVDPIHNNKTLSLEYRGIKGVSAVIDGPQVHLPLTFPQTLVENCSLTTLLPLMDQVDCIIEGKQQSTTSLSMIVMNMISILKYQPQSQIIFDEVNGIRSLTYLLSRSNEKHLDYMLYQNFIQLFETVTYEPLKNDIFEKILINPEIWVLSNGLSQHQISRYWSRQLFPNHKDLIKKYLSFQRLLKLLRIYYYYQPTEKNIAWLRRFDEIPVNDVRQNLMQILHTFATNHFSPADFSGLIAQIISCTDPDQVIDLLSFLKLLVVSPESPIQNVKDSWYLLSSLHQLIQSKNESILFNIIDVFMALHFLGLIQKPKVTRHVYVLMDLIPKFSLTNSFFLKILPLAKKYPTFMPIIFYIAMHLGETNLHFLKENLQPSPEIAVPKHWTLMPLLASLKFGTLHDFQEFVMKYMASCSDDKWDESFAQIALIQHVFKVDVEEEKSLFLGDVCERIITNNDLFKFDLLHTFLDVAIFHLFFKPNEEMNASLVHEFKNSPFSDSVSDLSDEPLPKSIPDITKDKFFESLSQHDFEQTRKFRFGLRFDREGHWLDRDLGKVIFKLAMKTKSQTFHNVSALILLFLYHETPDEVRSDIEMLIKRNVIDPPYADLLKRTVIDPKKKVGESCFEVFIRDSTPQNERMSQFINNLAGRLQRHYQKCKNEKEEIAEKADYGLKATISQEMHQEICVESHQRELYVQDWHVLWRMMTFDRFPWHSEKGNDLDILTRDNTLSDFYCPTQWKYKRTKYANFLTSTKKPTKMISRLRRADTQPVLAKPLESTLSFIDSGNTEINNIPINIMKFGNVSRLCNLSVNGSVIKLSYTTHSKEIPSSLIDEISMRLILHHQNGIEIITKGKRKGILINLLSQNSLSVLKQIASKVEFKNVPIQTQQMQPHFKEQNITEKWVKGELSNFRYLMLVNKFSGRTFLSESMYPVMPWIVKDYESSELNPNDESMFRDLSKPMVAGQPFSNPHSVINFLRKCEPFLSLSESLEFMPILKKKPQQEQQEKPAEPEQQQQNQQQQEKPAEPEQQQEQQEKPAEPEQQQQEKPAEPDQQEQSQEQEKPAEPEQQQEKTPAEEQQPENAQPEQQDQAEKPAETEQQEQQETPAEEQAEHKEEQPAESAATEQTEKPAETEQQHQEEEKKEEAKPEQPVEQPSQPAAEQPPSHKVMIQAPQPQQPQQHHPSSPSPPASSKAKRYLEFNSIPQAFAENEGRELTPEFFYSPEFFKGIELPKWAASPIEFVYKNRKMLESKYVTSHINEWIDLFFGVDQKNLGLDINFSESSWNDPSNLKSVIKKQEIELIKRNNGQIPPQIFKERHPTRTMTDFSPSVVCAHCFNGDGVHKHLFAKLDIKHVHDKSFVFSCVNTDHSIYNMKLDAEKNVMLTKDTSASFHATDFALYGTHIVGVDTHGALKIARDNGEAMELKGTMHFNPTDTSSNCSIASSQPITVIGYPDSSIALFHNNEFIKLIPTFSSSVTCIDVDACFGLIVAGNEDGSLLFLSSSDGTPKSCVNTNGVVPQMVMITKKWGFVLMYGSYSNKSSRKNVIDVYTTSGDLIRRVETSLNLTAWSCLASRTDFDYVVAADKSGKLYLFEAFYANINESFYDTSCVIKQLIFENETGVAFAFAENGSVYLAPCNVPYA